MEITIKFDKTKTNHEMKLIVESISAAIPAKLLADGDVFRTIRPDGQINVFRWTGGSANLSEVIRPT